MRSILGVVLGVVDGDFLHEGVGEGFHGGFGRGVGCVAGYGKEGDGGRGEDDVAGGGLGGGELLIGAAGRRWWRWRGQPVFQRGMRHVCCRPVDGVHLSAESVDGGLCKEAGDAVAGAAPDYGGRRVAVPFGDLGEDLGRRLGRAKIEGEAEEALCRGFG